MPLERSSHHHRTCALGVLGLVGMLAGCPIAAACLPPPTLEPTRETRELDVAVAMAFKWWDLAVQNKKPFVLPSLAPVHAHVLPGGSGQDRK